MTTLRELLATPYVMTARPVQDAEGTWIRQAECPELPGCHALAASPWDAFERLEASLPTYLLRAVLSGQEVPVPRRPLPGVDVELLLADLGLARFDEFLDRDIGQLKGEADPDQVQPPSEQQEQVPQK